MRNFNQFKLINMEKNISDTIDIEIGSKRTKVRIINIPQLGITNLPIPNDTIVLVDGFISLYSIEELIELNCPMKSIVFINKNPKILGRNYHINYIEDLNLIIGISNAVICNIENYKCVDISINYQYLGDFDNRYLLYKEILEDFYNPGWIQL